MHLNLQMTNTRDGVAIAGGRECESFSLPRLVYEFNLYKVENPGDGRLEVGLEL